MKKNLITLCLRVSQTIPKLKEAIPKVQWFSPYDNVQKFLSFRNESPSDIYLLQDVWLDDVVVGLYV